MAKKPSQAKLEAISGSATWEKQGEHGGQVECLVFWHHLLEMPEFLNSLLFVLFLRDIQISAMQMCSRSA